MDKNTRSGLFGGQIILERKHTLHLNFVCSLVVPSIYIYYLDDSTRKRKMGLGDLWPPHSREDSKAGLCHFFLLCCYFCFASTSTSEAVLMDYGDMRGGGCSASEVCAAPRCCYVLLWLSLLLMFCTLCSSVTYYILTYTT